MMADGLGWGEGRVRICEWNIEKRCNDRIIIIIE